LLGFALQINDIEFTLSNVCIAASSLAKGLLASDSTITHYSLEDLLSNKQKTVQILA
jgi:hypothetical protein